MAAEERSMIRTGRLLELARVLEKAHAQTALEAATYIREFVRRVRR